MWRSVLAVLSGPIVYGLVCLPTNWLIVTLFPQHFDDQWVTKHTGMLVLLVGLTVVFAGAAGYVGGWIARENVLRVALAMCVLLLAIGIAVQLQFWDTLPLWYHLTFFVLVVAGVLLGASLHLLGQSPEQPVQ